MSRRHRFFKWLGAACLIVMFAALFGTVVRNNRYVEWSRIPQPEIGRTIPHAARRSITVYISQDDDRFDRMLESIRIYSAGLLVICLFLSGELVRWLNQARKPPP